MSNSIKPSYLGSHAKPLYETFVALLESENKATEGNLRLCEMAAQSYHEYRVATDDVQNFGQTFRRESGIISKNPAVDNQQKYIALHAKVIRQLFSNSQVEEILETIDL